MKCILEYNAGEWLCLCDELFSLLANELTPDPDIVEAIQVFQQRYYPDETTHSPDYPWIVHENINKKTADLKPHVTTHQLTWHWRLLLPCLRDYDPSSADSFVLCVSQIRQWQLVSCFRMEWPRPTVAAEKLPAEPRKARKALLRPPVFGKSHRITRWEVYASFYEKGVKDQIKRAVESAKNAKDEFRLAHILGRYDAYFKVENVQVASGRYVFQSARLRGGLVEGCSQTLSARRRVSCSASICSSHGFGSALRRRKPIAAGKRFGEHRSNRALLRPGLAGGITPLSSKRDARWEFQCGEPCGCSPFSLRGANGFHLHLRTAARFLRSTAAGFSRLRPIRRRGAFADGLLLAFLPTRLGRNPEGGSDKCGS